MPFEKGKTPQGAKPFEKGQSGNPGGKAKGVKNRSTVLKKWLSLNLELTNPVTREKQKGTVEDEVILALVTKARKGDVAAIKEVLDTMYGKLTERTDLTIREEELDVVIARELERIAAASEAEDAGAVEANARATEKGV